MNHIKFTKNSFVLLLAFFLLCGSLNAFAAAETIIIDGQVASIPSTMGTIQEKDDRTFLPVRFVMEHLGCQVEYVDETRMAVISSPNAYYLIQDGNPILYVLEGDGTETRNIEMDTTPYIETTEIDGQSYGRMYIPIRYLAEAIGYTVGWDETTQTVSLTSASN